MFLISVTLLAVTGCEADHDLATRNHIKLKREVPSPDGRLAARYYVVTGGGAAGWAYEIVDIKAIHDSTPPVNKQEVFVMSHGGDVTMRWTGAMKLLIEYPAWAAVSRGCRTAHGVAIRYVSLEKPDSTWAEAAHVEWREDSLMKGSVPGPGSYPGLAGTCQ